MRKCMRCTFQERRPRTDEAIAAVAVAVAAVGPTLAAVYHWKAPPRYKLIIVES